MANKVNQIIQSTTKYYKWKEPGTDNWYAGKTESNKIPKDAYAISLYDYMLMSYGKAATQKAMKELKKIINVTGRGSIEIVTNLDIKHLPDANNPKFQQLITKN